MSPSSGARPFGQIVLGRAGAVAELADEGLPVRRDARRNREAELGVVDGGLERAGERPGAVGLEDRVPGFDRARHVDGVRRGRLDRAHALGEQRLGRGLGAGAAAAVVAPDRLAILGDRARSSRRRCRSCAARSRTAPRPRSPPHPPRCRRRRITSMAASVASGCEVAAMPSPAITGERPGRWKSRLMDGTGGAERAIRRWDRPSGRSGYRAAPCAR